MYFFLPAFLNGLIENVSPDTSPVVVGAVQYTINTYHMIII